MELFIKTKRTFYKELNKILKSYSKEEEEQYDENLSVLQRISKYEIEKYLLNTLLRDTDVLSMANSLEVRPVLLDHKLVEFAFRLPDEYKIKNNILKSVFIDSVKDLIPNEVWKRKKTGFTMPFKHWINDELNGLFLDLINHEEAKNFYAKSFISNLERKIKRKKASSTDWMHLVFLKWLVNNTQA